MYETINEALSNYLKSWEVFVNGRDDKQFFNSLKPVAVGWKVTDRSEYHRVCDDLHDKADKIIETWMNGRWIAKIHLRDDSLDGGVSLIKIMERRPGSTDATGLDHVDFYSKDVDKGEEILQQEKDIKWTRESNDVIAGYEWLSIWFGNTEAKLKSNTVLDIIVAELGELNQQITA